MRSALLDPATWGAREPVEIRETHISWVALTGDRAFKVKKSVTLPFLDYGTLPRRRRACEMEVALNSRLAPDLYLGVRALVPAADGGLRVAEPAARGAVEYAVEMRRFDESETLEMRVRTGRATREVLREVGAWAARFHEGSRPFDVDSAGAERSARRETFCTLRELGFDRPALERALTARQWARRPELDARAEAGRVRDGHGDLRAEHVLVRDSGGISAIDCIEFRDDLRRVDAGADLSFLVVDLVRLGRPDLAQALVDGYRDGGGDPGDDALVALFGASRALVRVKVDLLCASEAEGERALSFAARAERMVAVAVRLLWRAQAPLVLAVAGVAASGKSTLARAVSDVSGIEMLDSDRVRKELAGLSPEQRAPARLYDAEHDRATYRELMHRAGLLAREHGAVVVEATFRDPLQRHHLAQVAQAEGARCVFVECRAPAPVLRERAVRRARAAHDPSDATAAVALRQLSEWVPFEEPLAHVPVDTTRPLRDVLDGVLDGVSAAGRRTPVGVVTPIR